MKFGDVRPPARDVKDCKDAMERIDWSEVDAAATYDLIGPG
jgi:hypothetical protein